ncbi:MAG TPA: hypothetical protein VJG83_05640 [archaeon]|nr:hypothetical protein [archaeon]
MLLFGKSLDYALVAVKASTIRTNTSTFKKIEAVLKNKAMQSFADYIAGNKTVEQHGHFMNRLMQTFVTTMRFAGAQTEDVKKFETSIKKRFNELKSNSLKELIEQTQQSATLSDKPLKKTDFPKNNQN